MKIKRGPLMGSVLAGILVAGGLVMASQESASAAVNCNWSHSDKDSGYGQVNLGYDPNDRAVHSGPYADCPVIGYFKTGTMVNLHCLQTNLYGNDWSYVSSNSYSGWVWNVYLHPASTVPCGPSV